MVPAASEALAVEPELVISTGSITDDRSITGGRSITDELAGARTRSYLSDGRVVGWYGEAGVVIDAELCDRPVPAALAEAYGVERFWERWTAAECAAKLRDVPISIWLREHGLDPTPGVVVAHHRRGDVLVAVGRLADPAEVVVDGRAVGRPC